MRHLFLGGSKHGQILDVVDDRQMYLFPLQVPFEKRDEYPPISKRDHYETYLRQHQGMPDPRARTVAVYVLHGASMEHEFTRWLHETLREVDDGVSTVVTEKLLTTAVDTSPHIQIAVGGRIMRWNLQTPEAVLILQSLVQARGPGKDAS